MVCLESSDDSMGNFDEEKPVIPYKYEMRGTIVYTTKLDEMKIFKGNTSSMCVDTIVNSIIKESKPKLNLKRQRTHAVSSDYSYEDLSCYIHKFNRKVARIAETNNRLLSMCKPVRIVLQDFKYNLLAQSNTNKNYEISEPKAEYSISRKFTVKMVYDQQFKEADMYYLDKQCLVQGYNKFRIDTINDNMFHALEIDKNVSEVSCCCWFSREKCLNNLPLRYPIESVRFMRKPHTCAVNVCRCCCRQKHIHELNKSTSTCSSSLKPTESPSVWLNRLTEKHESLPIPDESRNTLLSKSLRMVSRPVEKMTNHPVIKDEVSFLHSTNIDFGEECYIIGVDGHIKLHLRNCKDRQHLPSLVSKTANNIVGDICCWYKREEFANRLLTLRALPVTVNYLRGVHPCSPTFCSCCCMPVTTQKTKVTLLPKIARHTNDLVSKKVNIKVRFSDIGKDIVPRARKKPATATNTNDTVSFDASLLPFGIMVASGNGESLPIDLTECDSKSYVRVFVEQSRKHKTVIECTQPLNSFTTKELRILDMIFSAVNKATKENDETKELENRARKKKLDRPCNYNTIYPLLLNTQLSIATDLRNKRFMPPLKAHLDKYKIPRMDNISRWMAAVTVLPKANANHE